MIDSHHCRLGVRRRNARPANTYEQLLAAPTREIDDDGAVIMHAGDFVPVCGDCGRGHLRWAEAGYVPWHRICDVCGSHWELHPITWGPALSTEKLHDVSGLDPLSSLVRWVDGMGEIPFNPTDALGDSGHTWGELLPLLTAEMWAQAEAAKDRMGGQVVIPCAWARRARFYGG